MGSRSIRTRVLAPAIVIALAAAGDAAAMSADLATKLPIVFGADTLREAKHTGATLSPGSSTSSSGVVEGLDDATQVAQCRRRRSRGGRSRSGSVASPTIVKIPGAKTAPKPAAEFSETAGTGGYYDENGVFHGDTASGDPQAKAD